jgi:hypothetical protein
MTVAQLAGAWSSELTESGEDPKQCEQNLVHILMVDIINGRLDDSGPLVEGRRLGLRGATLENRAGFIEGAQLIDIVRFDRVFVSHNVVVLKEAVLDFAKRHQLPAPSWWSGSDETPAPLTSDTIRDVVATKASTSGKQPRVTGYLTERFPGGVPEPGVCPRQSLKSDILEWDPSLAPLDEATLKKAIDNYNTSLAEKKLDPK